LCCLPAEFCENWFSSSFCVILLINKEANADEKGNKIKDEKVASLAEVITLIMNIDGVVCSALQLDSATSLIQSAKNLMNAVVLAVKASYVASTKYTRAGAGVSLRFASRFHFLVSGTILTVVVDAEMVRSGVFLLVGPEAHCQENPWVNWLTQIGKMAIKMIYPSYFSIYGRALTLFVGRQEGHLACKNVGFWFHSGDDLTGALRVL